MSQRKGSAAGTVEQQVVLPSQWQESPGVEGHFGSALATGEIPTKRGLKKCSLGRQHLGLSLALLFSQAA